jgi:hypothetical protein
MNSKEDTLGKGRCKCLFRHEKDDIVEGLVMLLDKRRMDNIQEQLKERKLEVDPIFESIQKITLDVLKRVRNMPLCIEEYKD